MPQESPVGFAALIAGDAAETPAAPEEVRHATGYAPFVRGLRRLGADPAALAVVGLWSGGPGAVVVACFAVFSFFNAVQGNLTAVYPIEILPTEVRSTGVGFGAALSCVGAAAGTLLLPVGIGTIGIESCMLVAAAVCVGGALLCQRLAPETTGQSLARSSAEPLHAGRG